MSTHNIGFYKQNYHLIIIKYAPYFFCCELTLDQLKSFAVCVFKLSKYRHFSIKFYIVGI